MVVSLENCAAGNVTKINERHHTHKQWHNTITLLNIFQYKITILMSVCIRCLCHAFNSVTPCHTVVFFTTIHFKNVTYYSNLHGLFSVRIYLITTCCLQNYSATVCSVLKTSICQATPLQPSAISPLALHHYDWCQQAGKRTITPADCMLGDTGTSELPLHTIRDAQGAVTEHITIMLLECTAIC
jgi:hypothetical protein